MRWADCVAVLAYDDGSRTVVGADGNSISLFPDRWDHYEDLRLTVEHFTPAAAWCPQGAPGPRNIARQRGPSTVALVSLAVALGLFGLLMLTSVETSPLGALFIGVGVLPIVYVLRRSRLRREQPAAFPARRGVQAWPTPVVACGGVASAVVIVIGIAAVLPLLIGIGGLATVTCVLDLRRRRRRRRTLS